MIKKAEISSCGKYRFSLTRIWEEEKKKVLFIMLNPSIGDGIKDDPTIRRCIEFAKSWGYGGLYIANLFPYRSTDASVLTNVEKPFGRDLEENRNVIEGLYEESDLIVCAWGNGDIVGKVFRKFPDYHVFGFTYRKLECLGVNNDGSPKHPLYLSKSSRPIPYTTTVGIWKN